MCCLLTYGQHYQWTGSAENLDFFDELNWKDTTTSEIPTVNSINPGQMIEFDLYITCEVVANNDINLGENGKITIINGQLSGVSVSGIGNIIMGESSYIYLDNSYTIEEGLSITFESNKSWIRLNNVEPYTAYYNYSDNFFQDNQVLSYPETLRIDNYYQNGSIIRPHNDNSSYLTVFSENNFNGEFGNIFSNDVYLDESIPNGLNNDISSFILKKGYMATFAENNDGTGNSKVFIASKEDIIIDELSEYLNNIIQNDKEFKNKCIDIRNKIQDELDKKYGKNKKFALGIGIDDMRKANLIIPKMEARIQEIKKEVK